MKNKTVTQDTECGQQMVSLLWAARSAHSKERKGWRSRNGSDSPSCSL